MNFNFNQKVLFKHCDPAGIVFYPRYFEMINDCVEAFFEEIGLPFEVLLKTAGVPTAQISTTFQNPSRHGDALVVQLTVKRIGRSSLDLSFRAMCGTELRFSAESTFAYIDLNGRAQPWPEAVRTEFARY